METNIKRSETTVKKNRDDWVDEKGFLHTKFTKETITGPIDNVQASQGIEEPLLQRIIRPLMNRPRFMMKGIPLQRVPRPQQPNIQPNLESQGQQVQPVQQPQQIPLDINVLMSMGKKVLEESGIDFKDLVGKAFKATSEDLSLEDKVEPLKDKADALTDEQEVKDKKWQKKNKQKPLKKQLKTNLKKKQIQKKIQMNKSE